MESKQDASELANRFLRGEHTRPRVWLFSALAENMRPTPLTPKHPQ
jgi:hypothetical protein